MKSIIDSIADIKIALNKRQDLVEKAIARGVTKGALLVQKTAVNKIRKGPKSGRTYGSHVASAPGEPPASDTGNLANSISVVKANPAPRAMASVNVAAPYGQYLEFGTLDGKIEPRPFLQASVDENAQTIDKMIKDEVAKVLNG